MEDGAGYARENLLATFFCSYMVPSNRRLSLGISRFHLCIDWHLVLFMYRQMYGIRLASGGDTSSSSSSTKSLLLFSFPDSMFPDVVPKVCYVPRLPHPPWLGSH